jgi:hypothetical protein
VEFGFNETDFPRIRNKDLDGCVAFFFNMTKDIPLLLMENGIVILTAITHISYA